MEQEVNGKTQNKNASHNKRGAPKGPRKASARRAALIAAAEKIFTEKGYEAATMDEIAASAGFVKGTLYHYFSNKAELLQALRIEFDRKITARILSNVNKMPTDDWHGRIRAWIEAAVKSYFELNKIHDVVIYGSGMPFRNAMIDSKITNVLSEIIHNGVTAGAWNVEDSRWTAVMMFYSFRGGCDEVMIGTQDADCIVEKLNNLFLRILGI
ncbi:TetR/AcrR family transcriptional regulator [Maridesulfovibrio bastinii]|uniref:TetR/AcrR family transcriptional regulator n=1 Tax=Maridesulfovibrio bastinii TaxID=47157 RepID=UPI000414EB8F|nr:TetR/AcrR family transcriptional regulator [Maridesulfovibrio bastinii]